MKSCKPQFSVQFEQILLNQGNGFVFDFETLDKDMPKNPFTKKDTGVRKQAYEIAINDLLYNSKCDRIPLIKLHKRVDGKNDLYEVIDATRAFSAQVYPNDPQQILTIDTLNELLGRRITGNIVADSAILDEKSNNKHTVTDQTAELMLSIKNICQEMKDKDAKLTLFKQRCEMLEHQNTKLKNYVSSVSITQKLFEEVRQF